MADSILNQAVERNEHEHAARGDAELERRRQEHDGARRLGLPALGLDARARG